MKPRITLITPTARIAIVGAGLSGRLLALNLLRQAPPGASIRMFDRADADSMGPAYSDGANYLLLNVPTGRMGAFSADPEHFMKWAQQRGVRADRWGFLPRSLYREYVLSLMRDAQTERTHGPRFEHLRAEVIDVEAQREGVAIRVQGEAPFAAEKAVLALGNFPPRDPLVQNRAALQSARYVRNPWDTRVLDALSEDESVLLVGSGQTTVDLAITLHKRGHKGGVFALSRHGLLPLPHRSFDAYPSFYGEIKDSTRLLEIFQAVRRHLDRADARGIDKRTVIDSLRPDTQALWLSLADAEKRRFLRHVFRYWEIIRSRIPPESQAIIDAMQRSGQLQVLAGRIRDLVETDGAMEVHYTPRGRTGDEVQRAALVINCIGPETDYAKIDHPLVRNMMRRGLIRPGPAHLGIDALPHGAVIGRDGAASKSLYTLGSMMKGILWEVLAVPDIRVQAERLAGLLLE